jgi:phosphomannomutase
MRITDLKISISGIRGIVGSGLTPQLLIKFAEAFATFIGGGRVAVASDTRPTAEMVKAAVFSGLLSCGASPIDLGILPIPSLQVYTREGGLEGALAVTASHNPVEWNALKLIREGGHFLYPLEAEELLDLYYQGRFERVAHPGHLEKDEGAFEVHLRKILAFADCELLRSRPLRVVVDPCAGAAAPYIRRFLQELGQEVEVIHEDFGQEFPRNPEPVAANLGALSEAVRRWGADLGLAQDADADRLAAVDETGTPIGEEYTLALAIEYYLKRKRRSPVVVNLSTSRVIEDITRQAGVPLWRTKVGEINVAQEMVKRQAWIGGEGNGGVMVADIHRCRDSFTGAVLLLEYLAFTGERLSTLKNRLPAYVMLKDKVPTTIKESRVILRQVEQAFPGGRLDLTDGVRMEFADFWFHVRPSNTEPVLRLLVEAREAGLAEEVLTRIKEIL